MAKKTEQLSTAEFSELTGVPASTITRLIREGQLKATKKSGKWMISKGQSSQKVLRKYSSSKSTGSAKAAPKKVKPDAASPRRKASREPAAKPLSPSAPAAGSGKTYSVSEFSQMTYLTDFGVTEWLKAGRLNGMIDDGGQWRIDGSSLELPAVKRLLR